MLFKLGFLNKVNTKKKAGYLSISSNRTLCITFVLSILFHVGLIYTIPAVDLFSEGWERTSSNMIVVDFIQEEIPEGQSETLQTPDNQFLASTPEEPENFETPVVLDQNDVEITVPPPKDKSLETDAQYMLLANAVDRDPEIEQLRKRPVVKQDMPIQQKTPELPRSEKLLAEHERLQPETKRILPLQYNKPSMSPIHAENSQKKDKPDEILHFPLEVHQFEKRHTFPENIPETRLGFGERPVKEIRDTTFSSSPIDVTSQISKIRRVGLSKEDENDKNRFGIFAGEKFEAPHMKETIQDAFAAEKKEAVSEETEAAKNLEMDSQIEGPVKGRATAYQPPPPQVDIENEVEFKLKFWVLPDGTIGEVIPIKRGDAKLERIAIEYLKKWQFEPLSPEVPQQKIWGTIPIRFTVR